MSIVLLAGGAWVAWSLWQSYQAGLTTAATTATPATPATSASATTPATPAPSTTPTIVIPAGFSVVTDINNSYRGTVTYNGTPTSFNVILANAGQSTGVVFNTSGTDVTALLGPANVTTLVNAFQSAVNTETVAGNLAGVYGLGQFIRVPRMIPLRRVR
jgi:hypothetical protein